MVNNFKLDKSVPVPPVREIYPLGTMEVGDSFTFPIAKRANLQTYTSALKRKTGKEYTISKISDTEARCWRRS